MTDEKRLFNAIQTHNEEKINNEFEYIYKTYKPLLIFIASKYLKNISDIDDVVQETFIEFFNDLDNIHKNIKAYLTIACKHNALDLLRKQKRIVIIDIDDIDTYYESSLDEDQLSNNDYKELISDMNKYLSNEDIKIILLHLIDNLKFNDIALKLELNVKTIKTRYYRALQKYQNIRSK